MPMPKNTPAIFDEILADYRHGTIDADEVRKGIAAAVEADPALKEFKDQHLSWTDYDDSVDWL